MSYPSTPTPPSTFNAPVVILVEVVPLPIVVSLAIAAVPPVTLLTVTVQGIFLKEATAVAPSAEGVKVVVAEVVVPVPFVNVHSLKV